MVFAENFKENVLKKAFRRVHSDVINGVNATSAIDYLIQSEVISDDDEHFLINIKDHREQCRHLLSRLRSSGHPAAFINLRIWLKTEKAYSHIVGKLDQQYQSLIQDQVAKS